MSTGVERVELVRRDIRTIGEKLRLRCTPRPVSKVAVIRSCSPRTPQQLRDSNELAYKCCFALSLYAYSNVAPLLIVAGERRQSQPV